MIEALENAAKNGAENLTRKWRPEPENRPPVGYSSQ
jgi:hypothetical protein